MGAGLVLLGAAGFSAKAVLIRLAYQQYPIDSLTLLALRMLLSVPFYVFIAARLRQQPGYEPLRFRQLLTVTGLGLTGYYAASLLDFMGLRYITASVERLILFVYPTIVLLVSALFFGKFIHGCRWWPWRSPTRASLWPFSTTSTRTCKPTCPWARR